MIDYTANPIKGDLAEVRGARVYHARFLEPSRIGSHEPTTQYEAVIGWGLPEESGTFWINQTDILRVYRVRKNEPIKDLVYPIAPIMPGQRAILARKGSWVVQKCEQIGQWLNRESFEIRHIPTGERMGPVYFSAQIAINSLKMADFWLNSLDMALYAQIWLDWTPPAGRDASIVGDMPKVIFDEFWGDFEHFLNAEHLIYCQKHPELAPF